MRSLTRVRQRNFPKHSETQSNSSMWPQTFVVSAPWAESIQIHKNSLKTLFMSCCGQLTHAHSSNLRPAVTVPSSSSANCDQLFTNQQMYKNSGFVVMRHLLMRSSQFKILWFKFWRGLNSSWKCKLNKKKCMDDEINEVFCVKTRGRHVPNVQSEKFCRLRFWKKYWLASKPNPISNSSHRRVIDELRFRFDPRHLTSEPQCRWREDGNEVRLGLMRTN